MFPTGNEKGDEMLEFWLWVYATVCVFQAVCGLAMREEGEEGWGALLILTCWIWPLWLIAFVIWSGITLIYGALEFLKEWK